MDNQSIPSSELKLSSNRNLIVTIVVVFIVLAAGGYFLMSRSEVDTVDPSKTEVETLKIQPPASTEKTSLKNFMSMSGDQECEFNDSDAGSYGTVYLNSGKFRGDFSSSINGKVTASHMINDSKDVYVWMDDQQTGFKTSLEAIEGVSGTTGMTQAVDINKQVDYSCESWTVDPVKFAVPAEIKFQDVGKMMQDAAKMTQSVSPASSSTGGNTPACAACDNLEGESKVECRSALKCN